MKFATRKRSASRNAASAFTLAEVLAALMFMAIVIPVAVQGLQIGRMYEPLGQELEGLKLALIGFGASGRELARRARPLQRTAADRPRHDRG